MNFHFSKHCTVYRCTGCISCVQLQQILVYTMVYTFIIAASSRRPLTCSWIITMIVIIMSCEINYRFFCSQRREKRKVSDFLHFKKRRYFIFLLFNQEEKHGLMNYTDTKACVSFPKIGPAGKFSRICRKRGGRRKTQKLPQKVSDGERSPSISHVNCHLCI
jgi:hypothetical protein